MDTYHGAGIWMDWDNRNSRCCQNIIVNAQTMHGGIFVEASYVPNLIDQNFIWDTRGHGIYEHDCSHQVFTHNFIGQSTGAGLHLHGKVTDRLIGRVDPEYGLHQVRNNLLYQNRKTNVFGGRPSTIAGNLSDGFTADFDRRTLELSLVATNLLPECEPVQDVSRDVFGNLRTGPKTFPGPFVGLSGQTNKIRLKHGTLPELASPRAVEHQE